jgi:hypothetical protein
MHELHTFGLEPQVAHGMLHVCWQAKSEVRKNPVIQVWQPIAVQLKQLLTHAWQTLPFEVSR